jgi:hypothetical protein
LHKTNRPPLHYYIPVLPDIGLVPANLQI